MSNKKMKIQDGILRAAPRPETFNEENNTLEVVWGSETPVRRYDWWESKYYDEVLDFSESAVNLSRFNDGNGPVLFNHNLNTLIGTVESARIENGRGVAVVRLASTPDVADMVAKIRDGILRSISIGYRVMEYMKTEREGEIAEYRATDWEPYELSFVTAPADATVGVRSHNNDKKYEVNIVNEAAERGENSQKMEKDNKTAEEREAEIQAAEVKRQAEIQAAVEAAQQAENERLRQINNLIKMHGIEDENVKTELRAVGVSLQDAGLRILDILGEQKNKTQRSAAVIGEAETGKRAAVIGEALMHRMSGANPSTIEGKAREYRGMSLLEIGKDLMRQAGQNPRTASRHEVASFLMGHGQRTMSTSDFPSILRDVANKRLLAMYEEFPNTWQNFSLQLSTQDFKTLYGERLESNVRFNEIVEGGTYQEAKFGETEETVRAKTYGKKASMTRQLIINDDLMAFERRLAFMARGAAQTQGDLVWALLLNNQNYQGSPVFAAGRNNFVSPGTAISIENIGIARAAMMKQQNDEGDDIMIVPSMLFVSPDQLTLAEQVLNSQTDIARDNSNAINPFSGRIQIIPEIRFTKDTYTLIGGTGSEWMLAATPSGAVAPIATTTVGDGGLFVDTRTNWDNDALEVKARFDFGAGIWNYRSVYFNAGA